MTSTPITYPPLTTTVNADPDPSSLYGLGPSFQFIEYGTDAPPPPPPPPPPPVTPPVTTPPPVGGGYGSQGGGGGYGGNSGYGRGGTGYGADPTRSISDVSRLLSGQGVTDPADPGYFTVPSWVDNLYRGVEAVAPWQVSLPMALAHTAAQLYNTDVTDRTRVGQGVAPLDFGQWLGSGLGFNPYGDLTNPLVSNRDQLTAAALGLSDPKTGESLYAAGPDKAETLTGRPASYGPFGIFGSSGPALSYQQANITQNPSLAPRVALATGENFANSLGYQFSPTTQAYRNLSYDPGGNMGSLLGTPISAGGINPVTGATEYTPGEAALRARALHLPSVTSSSKSKSNISGALSSGVPGLSGNDRDPTGYSSSAGGYGYQSGGGQSYDAASGSWGAPDDGNGGGGSGSGLGSNTRGGYARGGRVRSELSKMMDVLDSLGADELPHALHGPHPRPLGPLFSDGDDAPTLDLGLGDYHELPPLDPGPARQDVSQPVMPTPPAAPPPPAVAEAPPTNQAPGGPVAPDAYRQQVAALEGGGKDDAVNPTTGAAGKYQFLRGTWDDLAKRYPNLKLPAFNKMNWKDPSPQDLAMSTLTAENVAQLKKRYGLDQVGPAEQYTAHLLGASGGGRLLDALRRDPEAPVTRYVAPAAVVANKNVFYDRGGPLTVRQAYDHIQRSLAAGRWDLAA